MWTKGPKTYMFALPIQTPQPMMTLNQTAFTHNLGRRGLDSLCEQFHNCDQTFVYRRFTWTIP